MKKLLLSVAMLAGAVCAFAYDAATNGTTYYGSNCAAYGLDDGTVAIYTYYTTDGQTEVTFPATIQVYENEVMTAEYEVSAVGVSGWNNIYFGSTSAYQYNGSVKSLIFSEGIKTINAGAFYEMTSLTSVSLPKTLTTIGDYAFTACDNLASLTCYATSLTLGTDALKGGSSWDQIAANCVLRIPDGCVANYAAYTFDDTQTWTYWDEFYKNHNIHELTYPSITTTGYSTYYNDYGYTMPEGVEGYLINWTYGGSANLVKVYEPGDEVYAGLALVWKSTTDLTEETWYTVEALASGGNTAVWPVDDESTAYTTLLNGTQAATTTTFWGTVSSDYYYYRLANNATNGLGWYYGAAGGDAFTNGAHKAYLMIAKNTEAPSFISMFDNNTTGVEAVNREPLTANQYYDLSGRRVSNPTKGLYIVNGKKYMVK